MLRVLVIRTHTIKFGPRERGPDGSSHVVVKARGRGPDETAACDAVCTRGRKRVPQASVLARSEQTMPRYYFHVTNGKESLENPKGVDLPGNAAARRRWCWPANSDTAKSSRAEIGMDGSSP
jgi:hypothetical protein